MDCIVVNTDFSDSLAAGRDLGGKIATALGGGPADAVILFASPAYDHSALLDAMTDTCQPGLLVGASSAGEFTSKTRGEGMACAFALRAPEMAFSLGVGRGIAADPAAAATQLASAFRGRTGSEYAHRSALVLTDALAGHADALVEELTIATAGRYQFFGGGAGDNAQFRKTTVFAGRQALSDAAVGLEILSDRPLGIGVSHGWEPASPPMRVTETNSMRLVSLNGFAAADMFRQHAEETGQTFDAGAPIPFFLHNILGIDTGSGYRLRVPLAVDDDGAVLCAAEIPPGAIVHIMKSTKQSAVEAASHAAKAAFRALNGAKPKAALFFDCVATRLRMGDAFGDEIAAVEAMAGGAPLAGCNTHGQIARAPGQFGGFHNCTAVVCLLPE